MPSQNGAAVEYYEFPTRHGAVPGRRLGVKNAQIGGIHNNMYFFFWVPALNKGPSEALIGGYNNIGQKRCGFFKKQEQRVQILFFIMEFCPENLKGRVFPVH